MNKKRIISYVVLLMVLTALMSMFAGCATSEKNPTQTVKENVFIYDEDNIIDDDVEKTLNKMLVELEEKTEVEFSVVSVESVLGSIEDYANNLFNTFGIDKDNGVLLLFSQSDEKVILKIGRELKECLTDSECGQILDDYFVPYQEDDDYTKATEMTVKAVLTVIAEEYEIDIQGLETDNISIEDESNSKIPDFVWVIIIIAVIVILSIIIAFISGGDGSSGGYFGGSSGGFSGGGFGGGFSGGGGASR